MVTYTIDYSGPRPRGVVIGRTPTNARIAASADDEAIVQRLIADEPLGGRVVVATEEGRPTVTEFRPAS